MTQKDLGKALVSLRPGAEWSLRGATYADIDWLDFTQKIPSQVEITAWLTAAAQPTPDDVSNERARRLSLGFNYNFGDARGVHRIGTTDADMVGWDEVTMAASALINLGQGAATINIVTNTAPAAVTALEWQNILVAATQFRQPIWAASFTLQAMSPIPDNYQDNKYWGTP